MTVVVKANKNPADGAPIHFVSIATNDINNELKCVNNCGLCIEFGKSRIFFVKNWFIISVIGNGLG